MNKKPIIIMISTSDFNNDSRLQRLYRSLLNSDFKIAVIAYGSSDDEQYKYLSPIPTRSLIARLIDVAKMLGSRILSDNKLLKMLANRLITRDLTYNSHISLKNSNCALVIVKHWTSLPTAMLIPNSPKIWLDINEVFEAEHDNSKLWRLIYKPVIQRLLKVSEHRIVLKSATSLEQIKHMEDNKILHLPNTKQPLSELPKTRNKDRKIKLLYHGLITTNRALEALIEALGLSKRSDIQLTIRGHGKPKYIAKLKAKIENLGLVNQISFEPSIANSELIKATSSFDIGLCLFANHSQQLMFSEPNKIYEYMAAGLGIIASRTPTMERMVEDKAIGRLSAIGNTQADEVAKILSTLTIEKIDEWRENAYEQAVITWNTNYDWEKLDPFFKQIQLTPKE